MCKVTIANRCKVTIAPICPYSKVFYSTGENRNVHTDQSQLLYFKRYDENNNLVNGIKKVIIYKQDKAHFYQNISVRAVNRTDLLVYIKDRTVY